MAPVTTEKTKNKTRHTEEVHYTFKVDARITTVYLKKVPRKTIRLIHTRPFEMFYETGKEGRKEVKKQREKELERTGTVGSFKKTKT